MPLIKRYANRKLYDTESKRYITLEGIAEMIRQQQDVKVIDHETGEDITALTQAQIIFEQERKSAQRHSTHGVHQHHSDQQRHHQPGLACLDPARRNEEGCRH